MADVVQQPVQQVNVGGIFDMMFAPFHFIFAHLLELGLFVLMIVAVVVIIVLYLLNEEMKREQEDMLYKEYKDTVRTAFKNQNPKMYTSYYSKWNFLFFGIPIFHYKIGRKIFNERQELLGFYDGMFTDMLGNKNLMMWKDKKFMFFKDRFVLRLPLNYYKIEVTGQKNKEVMEVEKTRIVDNEEELVEISPFDKTINLRIINYKQQGFYYYPVYVDSNRKILDLTETINSINTINHSNILLEEVIKQSGKSVIGMAKVNTQLVFEQRKPEKVKDVEAEDN